MGIDFGTKRVGIALSDAGNQFAIPKVVLPNDKKLLGEIAKLCAENEVGEIILGESKNYAGQDNKVMVKIAAFKTELEKSLNIPVRLEPEFMTSMEALHIQGETAMHDASAAALILKSYLDKKHD